MLQCHLAVGAFHLELPIESCRAAHKNNGAVVHSPDRDKNALHIDGSSLATLRRVLRATMRGDAEASAATHDINHPCVSQGAWIGSCQAIPRVIDPNGAHAADVHHASPTLLVVLLAVVVVAVLEGWHVPARGMIKHSARLVVDALLGKEDGVLHESFQCDARHLIVVVACPTHLGKQANHPIVHSKFFLGGELPAEAENVHVFSVVCHIKLQAGHFLRVRDLCARACERAALISQGHERRERPLHGRRIQVAMEDRCLIVRIFEVNVKGRAHVFECYFLALGRKRKLHAQDVRVRIPQC
mmetsp:Transcript_47493/g.132419  ORF Transcript_47493/g.132419 Transcript_47493/m.132419 type:complete len:300 (+) Transcript_47493:1135-2034(+)